VFFDYHHNVMKAYVVIIDFDMYFDFSVSHLVFSLALERSLPLSADMAADGSSGELCCGVCSQVFPWHRFHTFFLVATSGERTILVLVLCSCSLPRFGKPDKDAFPTETNTILRPARSTSDECNECYNIRRSATDSRGTKAVGSPMWCCYSDNVF
jgi:hypothetical protein